MIGTIILCILILILAVLLLIPVRMRFSYEQGEIAANVQYGLVKLQLYPLKEMPEKAKSPKKEEKPEKEEKKEEKSESKTRISREQILYSLETLPPILGKALRRTGRRVRLEPLKIHLLLASPDPADTALLFGKLEAALAVGLPTLHRLVRIKDQDIQLFPDFVGERMDCIADVGIVIRPWDVLAIALPAGASLIKWLLRFKKLAPPPAEEKADAAADQNVTTEAA